MSNFSKELLSDAFQETLNEVWEFAKLEPYIPLYGEIQYFEEITNIIQSISGRVELGNYTQTYKSKLYLPTNFKIHPINAAVVIIDEYLDAGIGRPFIYKVMSAGIVRKDGMDKFTVLIRYNSRNNYEQN